jgi:AcrR family transcriptional regulator
VARTGRRPGVTDTRNGILAVARRHFTAQGYDGTTIRGIAGDAGVDPALVHHYFGAKDELFVAALNIPVNPAALMAGVLGEGTDGLGQRLVLTMLQVWDAADVNPLLMMLRSVASGEHALEMMREFITANVLRPLMTAVDSSDKELRAVLAATQLVGLLMARYVIGVEPLASTPPAELARIVGPNVQRYLTGDL